jgi:four helix bundle protein
MSTIRSHRDLKVWQRSVDFTVQVYSVTGEFPREETFGLSGQMRRASVSIASNIAEGFGRSSKEYGRYLQMALGSVAELETQIEIAHRISFISDEKYTELMSELTIVGKQLNALRQSVLRSSR